ncbi:hypothetical protein [Dorea longicatena]|uniref:hypothetical protein n=1 Tax=Dorea longicatena TaxID=88431 RepID=UPI0034A389ED
MAKITAVAENVKVEDATVEETVTPVEDVVVEPEETIDSDFSVDNTEESYDEDVMPLPSGEEDATPVYNGDVAQQSSETIGKKWNEYTTGTDLDDTDELMILDTSAKANKRTLLSKLADYVLGKLADKVFEKLETQNKTILGALNELNSKAFSYNFQSNSTVTLSFKIACIFSFVRSNQNKEYTGIINVDQFGSSGTVSGISIKVENKKVTITNISGIAIYCVGVVC